MCQVGNVFQCILSRLALYLNLQDVLRCQVSPENLIGHKCPVFLQNKLSSCVPRQDVEVEGRPVVGGVQVDDGQLNDAGADRFVLLINTKQRYI